MSINRYSPFTDQEEFEVPVVGLIVERDDSPSYELSAVGLFKAEKGYLIIWVSGCSCWPYRGSTTQTYCATKAEVSRELRNEPALLDAAQAAQWKVEKL